MALLARSLGLSDTVCRPLILLLGTRLQYRQRTWHVGFGKLLAETVVAAFDNE